MNNYQDIGCTGGCNTGYNVGCGNGCNVGCKRACCGDQNKALGFLAVLLAAALGLIFGTIYYETFLPALPALILFAVTMAVAIIAVLIYRWSRRCCCG